MAHDADAPPSIPSANEADAPRESDDTRTTTHSQSDIDDPKDGHNVPNGVYCEKENGSKRDRTPPGSSRSSTTTIPSRPQSRAPKIQRVVHKIEYRHVSTNNIVWEEESDRFAPTKTPPEQPVIEAITIVFTAQDRSPYSHRREVLRAPPIHSVGHKYIQINSAAVVNALRSVVEYFPGQNMIGDSLTISEPYIILIHHEKELAAYRENFAPNKTEPDAEPCSIEEETYEHLGIVLEFIQQTLKGSLEKERARHAREVPVCTYDMLWTLFKPGVDVYLDTQSCGILDPYVVRSVNWEIINGSPVRYVISLWNLHYNSIFVGPRIHETVVLPFNGEKEIADMEIFPCEYLRKDKHKETAEEMRKRLEDRGRMFYRLTSKQCMWYDGLTTTFPRQRVSRHLRVLVWILTFFSFAIWSW